MTHQTQHNFFDVITIGGNTLDLFIKSGESKIISIRESDYSYDYLAFEYGKKVYIDSMPYLPGGGGNNTAVAFSRLGLKVAYLGCVGQDNEGRRVMMNLKAEGVRTDFVYRHPTQRTGMSVIINSFEGDRTVFSARGANEELCIEEDRAQELSHTKWFYIPSLNKSAHENIDVLVGLCREHGIKIGCNPGNVQLSLGLGGLRALLQQTVVLVLNTREAERLTGKNARHKVIDGKDFPDGMLKGEPWISDLRDIMQMLYENGPRVVVVTEGEKGAQAFDGENFYWMPPYPLRALDTLGAGDAYASTLVASQIMGISLLDGLKMAAANSSLVIEQLGSQTGLGDRDKIDQVIASFPHIGPVVHKV